METSTDFLVIGSGIAGLTFALKVAEFGDVAIVTKKDITDSNTMLAQGGIASVFDRLDSFDLHIKDTLDSGDGLCNGDVVDFVVRNGPERIRELVGMGVHFSIGENKDSIKGPLSFDLGREGGHSKNRIVHAKDMTGKELESVIARHVKRHPRIKIYENHIAVDLITYSTRLKRGLVTTSHEDYCCGAYVLDRKKKIR